MTGCSEDPDPATGADDVDAGDAAFRVVPVVTVHKENLDRLKSTIVSDIQVSNQIEYNYSSLYQLQVTTRLTFD